MSKILFEQMADAVKTNGPALVKQGGAVYQFVISDTHRKFYMDLKNGAGATAYDENPTADCTISMREMDFLQMDWGNMQAFMGGKLKITGNMMLAQKLGSIIEAVKGQ